MGGEVEEGYSGAEGEPFKGLMEYYEEDDEARAFGDT